MAQMNPQFGGFMNNQYYQQTWAAFQQMMQNQQMQRMQQMQQMQQMQMQQQQFMIFQQFMAFQQFCNLRGLNPQNLNSFQFFLQQQNMGNLPVQQFPQPPVQQFPQPQVQQFPQPQVQQFTLSHVFQHPIFPQPQTPHQPQPEQEIYIGKEAEPTPLIPRLDRVLSAPAKPNEQFNTNLININFKASNGLSVIINIPINATIGEMCRRFMERLNLPLMHLANGDVQFLFNGKRLDSNSMDFVGSRLKNGNHITVFDQRGVIGALS